MLPVGMTVRSAMSARVAIGSLGPSLKRVVPAAGSRTEVAGTRSPAWLSDREVRCLALHLRRLSLDARQRRPNQPTVRRPLAGPRRSRRGIPQRGGTAVFFILVAQVTARVVAFRRRRAFSAS